MQAYTTTFAVPNIISINLVQRDVLFCYVHLSMDYRCHSGSHDSHTCDMLVDRVTMTCDNDLTP